MYRNKVYLNPLDSVAICIRGTTYWREKGLYSYQNSYINCCYAKELDNYRGKHNYIFVHNYKMVHFDKDGKPYIMVEDEKLRELLKNHIKSLLGKHAGRTKGQFWNIYHDKSSVAWGWTEPEYFEGYYFVWIKFSPIRKGEESSVYYDYVSEEEFNRHEERVSNGS